MKFIKDAMRVAFLNAIANRIRRNKSVLVTGRFGHGKTDLLKQIGAGPRRIQAESLGPVYWVLGTIAGLSRPGEYLRPAPGKSEEYLRILRRLKNTVILMDEAHHLKPAAYPYLKSVMDAGVPMVLAGVPELEETLRERAEDVFSRFKVLRLLPVSADDFKSCIADDFEPDAVDLIYGASDGNMRIFEEFCDDCRDKAMETGTDKVTVDIALQFIEK